MNKNHPFFDIFLELLISAAQFQRRSMRQIARESGIAHTALSNYKQRRSMPNGATLCRLADYFGVSTDYLLGREGYYYPKENEENGQTKDKN